MSLHNRFVHSATWGVADRDVVVILRLMEIIVVLDRGEAGSEIRPGSSIFADDER